MKSKFDLPHPAIVCGGPQLLSVIAEMEAGTCPLPEDAIWRDDLPREMAARLAKATGATDEQIAEIVAPAPAAADHREPEPEPPAKASRGVITITHNHADGTLVYGTSKGDGVYELIGPRTAARFRYFPSLRMLGIAQSRDHLAKRWQIEQAAKALRAAGFEVTVEIDDTPRDVTEVKADRAERLDDRYDRLSAKAGRNSAEADRRFAAADHYAERFAGGQPILVGHHSERGARVAQKRIDQNMRAGVDALSKAEHAAQAAAVVGTADAYRERPGVIIRRIDKAEAELRQTMHYINGTRPANDWRGAYGHDRKPAEGSYLEQLTARKVFLEHQLTADKEALAAHVANGYVLHSRETIHKGDTVSWSAVISGRPAETATVTRTNPKTVTLSRTNWPRTLPYEQIRTVECPHEGTVTTGAPSAPLPRRERPAVTAEVPAVRVPAEVDARSECFATPAPVIAKLAALAGLKPGMDVLEPSAGTGAIASAVAALGCDVWCIEINERLARGLGELPCLPRSACCLDFLATDPQAMADEHGRPRFDRVIMNPPFSQEVRHVLHAHRFLRAGGLLVAVMSAGVQHRADRAAFREFVSRRGGSIRSLPDDSFAVSGANVRTVIVTIPADVLTG